MDTFFGPRISTSYTPLNTGTSYTPFSASYFDTTYTPLSTTYAPFNTTYTPLSPTPIVVDNVITPIIPSRDFFPYYSNYPQAMTTFGQATIFQPSTAYYYDSGIGENPLAQYETNAELRHKFLNKWLYVDYPEILHQLRVIDGSVVVLSDEEAKKNDISKDSADISEKKSNFIGYEILSLSKNHKILSKLITESRMKYYDLPHNHYFVKKAQAKYVKMKLNDMKKKKFNLH